MADQFDQRAMELAEQVRLTERRETLEMLLVLRFGLLSVEARERLGRADAAVLDAAFTRLASATRWQDVFA